MAIALRNSESKARPPISTRCSAFSLCAAVYSRLKRTGLRFRLTRYLPISYGLWQSWFGGSDVIGRKVQVNALPRTIIGVLPPGFCFLNREIDLWEPVGPNPARGLPQNAGILDDVFCPPAIWRRNEARTGAHGRARREAAESLPGLQSELDSRA